MKTLIKLLFCFFTVMASYAAPVEIELVFNMNCDEFVQLLEKKNKTKMELVQVGYQLGQIDMHNVTYFGNDTIIDGESIELTTKLCKKNPSMPVLEVLKPSFEPLMPPELSEDDFTIN